MIRRQARRDQAAGGTAATDWLGHRDRRAAGLSRRVTRTCQYRGQSQAGLLLVQSRGTLQEGVPSAGEVQVEEVREGMNFSCVKCVLKYGLYTDVRTINGL